MTTYYMQDKHDHYRYTRISKPRAYWEWLTYAVEWLVCWHEINRARSITSVGVSGIGCLVGPIARRWKAAILRSSPILTHFARWSIPTMAVWPSLPPIDSCRPVFSSLPPDGIPFLTKYGI